jgi:transposase-like protein
MVADLGEKVESAHTIDRTSARSSRVEVLPRAERRRSWTAEQKLAIVGESLGPDLTPTDVARKHQISTGQIYTWRQQFLSCERPAVSRMAPHFTAVELAPACPSVHPPLPELASTEYDERDDVAGQPGPVQHAAAALVELPTAVPAAKPAIALCCDLRPLRHGARAAVDTTHRVHPISDRPDGLYETDPSPARSRRVARQRQNSTNCPRERGNLTRRRVHPPFPEFAIFLAYEVIRPRGRFVPSEKFIATGAVDIGGK